MKKRDSSTIVLADGLKIYMIGVFEGNSGGDIVYLCGNELVLERTEAKE
jgi:hypothetical protein